ncbi:MAG: hypothetical protein LC104_06685 [Bacteroidales bacterium]|nr:hypothetical protein [Bacteroidales bacterium]
MSYQTKIYKDRGGDRMVLASGGELEVQDGATITANGTQAESIADVPTSGAATMADNATAINSILAALRGIGVIAAS